jgi:hypothetical protein
MSWSEIIEVLVMLVIGLLGMPLTAWLKARLKWSDLYAFVLTAAVAVVLSFAELFLMGDLSIRMFTLENFGNVFTAVFTVSQIWFRILKEGAIQKS